MLRPLLAIKWIEQGLGRVPTEFQVLLDRVVDSAELREESGKLVAAKRRGEELDRGPRIERISAFLESELLRLDSKQLDLENRKAVGPVAEFDRVFRAALEEVWS